MQTKVCSKCGVEKGLDEYYQYKERGTFFSQCKKCVRQYQKTYDQNVDTAKRMRELREKNKSKKIDHKGVKVCSRCAIEKPKKYFHRDNGQKSGFRPECKECYNNYLSKTKEHRRKVTKEYRENNRAYFIKYMRKYYTENKVKALKWGKEYYINNKPEIDRKKNEYKKTEKFKEWRQKVLNSKTYAKDLMIRNLKRREGIDTIKRKDIPDQIAKTKLISLQIKRELNND